MPGTFSPIPEVQLGPVAYLFGINNNGAPISMTGLASFELESEDVSLNWTEKDNKDTTGNTQNITQTDFKYERSVKFNPSGATRAAAHTVGDAVFTLISLVTAGYKLNTLNGLWRIKPGTKISLKSGDNASIDISCERYANLLQNAALNGTPIVG